jgi:mannitol/fructose-specific phosphotransferase system IIA component
MEVPQTEEELQAIRQAIFDQCVKWREQREAKLAASIAKKSERAFDKAVRITRKAERAAHKEAEFARKFRPGARKSERLRAHADLE